MTGPWTVITRPPPSFTLKETGTVSPAPVMRTHHRVFIARSISRLASREAAEARLS